MDFYHESVHRLEGADLPPIATGEIEAGLPAVAVGEANAQEGEDDSTSNEDDSNDELEDFSTIAVASDSGAVKVSREEIVLVRTDADKQVELVMDTIHAIQVHLEGLRAVGCTRGVQCLEQELQKAKRKLRSITRESTPAFDTFSRVRHVEEMRRLGHGRVTAERKERWRDAQTTIAEEKAAKELQVKRQKLQELENISACKHAAKSYFLEDLGKGANNAGGAKGEKNRWEVLDRLAR